MSNHEAGSEEQAPLARRGCCASQAQGSEVHRLSHSYSPHLPLQECPCMPLSGEDPKALLTCGTCHLQRGSRALAKARKALFPIQTSIMSNGKAIFLPNCDDPRGCAYVAALLKQVTSLGSVRCGAGNAPHGPLPEAAPVISSNLNKTSISVLTPLAEGLLFPPAQSNTLAVKPIHYLSFTKYL